MNSIDDHELPRSVELFKKITSLEKARQNIQDQIDTQLYDLEKNTGPELLQYYSEYLRLIYQKFGGASKLLNELEAKEHN